MTREQLKTLPKCEFHLHLEGSLPYHLLTELNPCDYGKTPPFWDDDYRFPSFPDFDRDLLSMAGAWFTSTERYRRGAEAVFAEAARQGVRYLETSIASGCLEFGGLDLNEICAAVKSAVPADMEVRLFLGIHHSGYSQGYAPVIEASLTCPDLDGYDIHGNEKDPLDNWAADFYARARSAGKYTKCHAGEFMGPEFVMRAVEELGVTRLEHGVRASEKEETMDLLARKNIVLDVCPVSNLKLKVTPSLEEHPLRLLTDRGVKCTINRDDPLIFGSTLDEEYFLVQEKMGFCDEEIIRLIKNGYDAALVTPETREALHRQLDETLRGFGLSRG